MYITSREFLNSYVRNLILVNFMKIAKPFQFSFRDTVLMTYLNEELHAFFFAHMSIHIPALHTCMVIFHHTVEVLLLGYGKKLSSMLDLHFWYISISIR
jgi:hypothetical protein